MASDRWLKVDESKIKLCKAALFLINATVGGLIIWSLTWNIKQNCTIQINISVI